MGKEFTIILGILIVFIIILAVFEYMLYKLIFQIERRERRGVGVELPIILNGIVLTSFFIGLITVALTVVR